MCANSALSERIPTSGPLPREKLGRSLADLAVKYEGEKGETLPTANMSAGTKIAVILFKNDGRMEALEAVPFHLDASKPWSEIKAQCFKVCILADVGDWS